ncbi:MAG: hypothetical protein MUF43_12655 [Flavobacterium sp.]|jgi:hypothetical protein|nr:hypothetical protein [Flavobacterium sp.]
MIAINEIRGDEEQFNWWLTIMPDVLLYLSTLPKEVRTRLDYSVESLDVLERHIIENFDLQEMEHSENKMAVDLFARYIGQTFKKNLTDVIWEMETRVGWFGCGFPLLNKRDNKPFTKQSPYSFVFGALDRKSGNYLSNILKHNIENEIKWEGRVAE